MGNKKRPSSSNASGFSITSLLIGISISGLALIALSQLMKQMSLQQSQAKAKMATFEYKSHMKLLLLNPEKCQRFFAGNTLQTSPSYVFEENNSIEAPQPLNTSSFKNQLQTHQIQLNQPSLVLKRRLESSRLFIGEVQVDLQNKTEDHFEMKNVKLPLFIKVNEQGTITHCSHKYFDPYCRSVSTKDGPVTSLESYRVKIPFHISHSGQEALGEAVLIAMLGDGESTTCKWSIRSLKVNSHMGPRLSSCGIAKVDKFSSKFQYGCAGLNTQRFAAWTYAAKDGPPVLVTYQRLHSRSTCSFDDGKGNRQLNLPISPPATNCLREAKRVIEQN